MSSFPSITRKPRLKKPTDPPLLAYSGSIREPPYLFQNEVYYRNLVAGNGLEFIVNEDDVSIGISGGSGTVTEVNGITGSVSINPGLNVNIGNTSSGVEISINSTENANALTIPLRNNNGNFKVSDPLTDFEVANKRYVDNVSQGLRVVDPVRVVQKTSLGVISNTSGAGIDVVASGNGIGKTLTNDGTQTSLVIDGVTLNNGDRVLIAGDNTHNGVYNVVDTGSVSTNWVLERSLDLDQDSETLSGTYMFVSEGTEFGSSGFTLVTPNPIIVDTTPQRYTQFNSAGQLNAINIGTSGLGFFKTKNGNNLEFYNLNVLSNKIKLIDNRLTQNEIDLDIDETEFSINALDGLLFPEKGGTGRNILEANRFLVGDGLSAVKTTKNVPSGEVLGDTDTQTLTNKTILDLTNTIGATELMVNSGASVNISGSSTPLVGQILTATSPTTAEWKDSTSLNGTTTPNSTSLGVGSTSTPGNNGLALGDSSNSSGFFSIAVGTNSQSINNESIAIGRDSVSSHIRSIVLGNTNSDQNNQLKVIPNIDTFTMSGLADNNGGKIVSLNSSGNIGPSETGSVILPLQNSDPPLEEGGVYFNTSSQTLRISNGVSWNNVALSPLTIVSGMNAISSPNIIQSFNINNHDGGIWEYVLYSDDGINKRSGKINSIWQNVLPTPTNEYNETTTIDIGDTSPINLEVVITNISGVNYIQFISNVTSGNWIIKFYPQLF